MAKSDCFEARPTPQPTRLRGFWKRRRKRSKRDSSLEAAIRRRRVASLAIRPVRRRCSCFRGVALSDLRASSSEASRGPHSGYVAMRSWPTYHGRGRRGPAGARRRRWYSICAAWSDSFRDVLVVSAIWAATTARCGAIAEEVERLVEIALNAEARAYHVGGWTSAEWIALELQRQSSMRTSSTAAARDAYGHRAPPGAPRRPFRPATIAWLFVRL